MIKSIKARTPILALILFVFAVGYTIAATNKVVVIPLGGDSPPSGMVSAFNSEVCPAGWVKFTEGRGRFIVGLNDGGTLGYTLGTRLGNGSQSVHNHRWAHFDAPIKRWTTYDSFGGGGQLIIDWGDGIHSDGAGYYPLSTNNSSASGYYYTGRVGHSPPYIQLLYCEKV